MWHTVKELRNVPIVSVDFMFDNFLPKVCINVQATKDSLKDVDNPIRIGLERLKFYH